MPHHDGIQVSCTNQPGIGVSVEISGLGLAVPRWQAGHFPVLALGCPCGPGAQCFCDLQR